MNVVHATEEEFILAPDAEAAEVQMARFAVDNTSQPAKRVARKRPKL